MRKPRSIKKHRVGKWMKKILTACVFNHSLTEKAFLKRMLAEGRELTFNPYHFKHTKDEDVYLYAEDTYIDELLAKNSIILLYGSEVRIIREIEKDLHKAVINILSLLTLNGLAPVLSLISEVAVEDVEKQKLKEIVDNAASFSAKLRAFVKENEYAFSRSEGDVALVRKLVEASKKLGDGKVS